MGDDHFVVSNRLKISSGRLLFYIATLLIGAIFRKKVYRSDALLHVRLNGCDKLPQTPADLNRKSVSILNNEVATLAFLSDVRRLDESTGKLKKGDKNYYGAGVNYYDAFYGVVIHVSHSDTSYRKGIRILEQMGIPFIRFSLLGFYPDDLNYYKDNEADYFSKLDAFVQFAKDHNVGLIPSFFWMHSSVSDFVGEKLGAWAHLEAPGNKTNAFITSYVQKIVTRYGNRKAISAWEFGNETNINADLTGKSFQEEKWIYPVTNANGQGGILTSRSREDTFHTRELNIAYNKFQGLVHYLKTSKVRPTGPFSAAIRRPTWECCHANGV